MPFPVREILGYVGFGAGGPVLVQIVGGLTGFPTYPFGERELAALRGQGWDERLDPEPHCFVGVIVVYDKAYITRVEYVNPHHNTD